MDALAANLVGGKSIREINEMLSGSGNSGVGSTDHQPFSGGGGSFMNSILLNSGPSTDHDQAQASKSKAMPIGSERHRPPGPIGLPSGMPPPPQPPQNPNQLPMSQGVMPPPP